MTSVFASTITVYQYLAQTFAELYSGYERCSVNAFSFLSGCPPMFSMGAKTLCSAQLFSWKCRTGKELSFLAGV